MNNDPVSRAWRILAGAAAAAAVAACASVPPPTEQLAVSTAAVTDATRAGGYEYAPDEMRLATEELARANAAMSAKDYALARRAAEQAEVDARLASASAGAAKSNRALNEVQASNRALQSEIDRRPPPR